MNHISGKLLLACILFFGVFYSSYAQPSAISQTIVLDLGIEANRTLPTKLVFRGQYELGYLRHYKVVTGVSLNVSTGLVNGIYIMPRWEAIGNTPLSVNLLFLGNQYGEYNRSANSIIPFLEWKSSSSNHIFVAQLGANFRFLNTEIASLWNIFSYPPTSREALIYYKFGYYRHLFKGFYTLGAEFKNNSAFYAGNMGTFIFTIQNIFALKKDTLLRATLDFQPAGNIALTATYYKFTIRCGVEASL